MPYTLYIDKAENFECDIKVKNASLKNAFARLIVESEEGINLMFHGELKNGKCIVPIKKVKGLLEENARGKMHLEVVVEDTYFKPWEDNFTVEEHTKVQVQIKEQTEPSKPTISISPPKQLIKESPSQKRDDRLFDMALLIGKAGITLSTLKTTKRTDFKQVLKEYFKTNRINQDDQNKLIKELVSFLK